MRGILRDGWGTVLLFFVLGAALIGQYVHVTPFETRTHDPGSHVAYLQWMERRHGIPLDTDCWECAQPAGYYLLAEGVLRATHAAMPERGMPDGRTERILQRLAGALALGTLAFWLLAVRVVLRTPYERTLASALCTFWPTLPIEGAKFGNDPLLYLLAGACVWLLLRWRRSGSAASLVAAAGVAGLSVHAKISGFVVVAVFVASLAGAVVRAPAGERRWPRGGALALAGLAAPLALWAFVLARYKHWTTHPDFSSTGHKAMDNTWGDFLWVHVRSFAEDPWVHFGKSDARDEFWNYLLRSSLFGEYSSGRDAMRVVASLLAAAAAALLLLVAAGLVVSVVRGLRRQDAGHRELALTVLGFLAFMIVLRLRFPIAPHNDFRFALPIVPCCAAMAAIVASMARGRLQRRWPHLAALPGWLVAAFCAASASVTLMWP